MPRITAIGTATPPNLIRQDEIRVRAWEHFGQGISDIDRLIGVFEGVAIQERRFCVPLEWFLVPHDFSERNDTYQHWAEELSTQAAGDCLHRGGVTGADVDHVVFVSTSGMATPSIDARLFARLGLGMHTRRTPVFGLGCAGGAAGLTRCWELATAHPGSRVLLIAVELSSLTFQPQDFRKANLVAAALFSDGAAAVLVEGDDVGSGAISVLDAQSTLWPDTRDVMGWDFTDTGLRVIFSRTIPFLLKKHIRANVENLLARHSLRISDIRHFVVHPGGAKILDSLESALEVGPEAFQHSRFVLENLGNMSSPTMLFILDRVIGVAQPQPGDLGLCAAFGPGFSSELLLIKWD